MIFNSDHKVDINSLDTFGAEEFVAFLEEEKDRHKEAIRDAIRKMGIRNPIYDEFLNSQVLRHEEDVSEIKELIIIVKEKFGL